MQFESYPSLYVSFAVLFHSYIAVLRQVCQVLLQAPVGLQLQSLWRFLDFGFTLLWPPAAPFRFLGFDTVGLVFQNRLLSAFDGRRIAAHVSGQLFAPVLLYHCLMDYLRQLASAEFIKCP